MSARVTLTGRLGREPELRFTSDGKAVASFSMVTSRRVKDGDGWKDADATWWPVTCWDRLAEHVVNSLAKGDPVIVEGAAVERSWEDRDGSKRSRIEVRADHVGLDLRWQSNAPKPAASVGDPWESRSGDDVAPF